MFSNWSPPPGVESGRATKRQFIGMGTSSQVISSRAPDVRFFMVYAGIPSTVKPILCFLILSKQWDLQAHTLWLVLSPGIGNIFKRVSRNSTLDCDQRCVDRERHYVEVFWAKILAKRRCDHAVGRSWENGNKVTLHRARMHHHIFKLCVPTVGRSSLPPKIIRSPKDVQAMFVHWELWTSNCVGWYQVNSPYPVVVSGIAPPKQCLGSPLNVYA